MKKLITLLAVICSLSLNAQITLQTTVPGNIIYKVSFTNYGDKYYTLNAPVGGLGDTITIFNSDGSVFKQIDLPNGWDYADYMSDNLFNNDSLIEFLAIQQATISGIPCHGTWSSFSIMNELGATLFAFPPMDTITCSMPGVPELINIGNNYKLTQSTSYNLYNYASDSNWIYSLTGSIPCNPCGLPTGITEPISNGGKAGLIAYPNPFNNTLAVEYNLPSKQDAKLILTAVDGRELKTIKLNNQPDKLLLNTADLPRGIILISLYDNNQHLISKKLIKIE